MPPGDVPLHWSAREQRERRQPRQHGRVEETPGLAVGGHRWQVSVRRGGGWTAVCSVGTLQPRLRATSSVDPKLVDEILEDTSLSVELVILIKPRYRLLLEAYLAEVIGLGVRQVKRGRQHPDRRIPSGPRVGREEMAPLQKIPLLIVSTGYAWLLL